jgi:hypothetical protein
MTLAARLLNVFAVPGEVFAELKTAPMAVSNWLVPGFFGALIGVLSVLILLSQPTIQQQFRDQQNKFIEQRVKSGQLTPQARRVVEWFGRPSVLKALGSASTAAASFGNVLWWGFALWLLARVLFRVQVRFSKTLEIAGLAMMINVLGGIVAMLLIVSFGRIGASTSLALVVKDFDATRKGYLFAVAANVFSVWVVGVRSIGLAKLTGVPYLRAAWAVFTFWVLEQSLLIMIGAGKLGM